MNALELRGVTYRYGRRVVPTSDDLTVPFGSVAALAGADGAFRVALVGATLASGLLVASALAPPRRAL